ncbi:hypothetical protein BC832DRAFT_449593 [Gaertneriomyces semiglobifer]|nr:hypothetical protein BC832DRAFT_449593 [Gaertneriomyces semiglobifer]
MSTQLVPFGSPSAARRSTPNVLFLIDIRPWLGVTDSYVLEIKQAVLRILLYFYIYVDARFCWSYRLLDTSEISALGNKGSLGLCHSQEFNPEALALFDKALEEAYESTSHGRSSSELPPAQRACIALRRSLTEFRWNWVAAAGMMPSPAKPTASRQLQAPVRLRNHLFIITPLPGSASDLSQFVGKAQQGHSVQAVTPIAHLQHWKKMDAHLDLLHHDLLNDGMWTGILERRAALCWVDLPRQLSHPGALMERSYIHASISATLSAYGGSVLSSDTLLRPHSGVSFASLFRLLRVTVLDPRLGRSLLSKQRKSRMALLENALLRICSSSNSEVWSGKLLLDSEGSFMISRVFWHNANFSSRFLKLRFQGV